MLAVLDSVQLAREGVGNEEREELLYRHDEEDGYDAPDKDGAHVDTKVGSKQAFVSCRLAN